VREPPRIDQTRASRWKRLRTHLQVELTWATGLIWLAATSLIISIGSPDDASQWVNLVMAGGAWILLTIGLVLDLLWRRATSPDLA
jgi:hypothetical protein